MSSQVKLQITLLSIALFGPFAHGQTYSLDWFTISGGGGTSAGGGYSLRSTVGQPGAGPAMSGATFTVYGGFWSLISPPTDLPPFLPGQNDWIIDVLTTLAVTNTGTSFRGPGGALKYQLIAAPVGAAINRNGVITWTPTQAQGPSTNTVMTVATDNGSPALGATNSFAVVVRGLYSAITLTNPASAIADPNGDGFSYLLKFALGIDPAAAAGQQTALVTSQSRTGGLNYLTMTFLQRKNAPWLQYFPEVSGDNQVWYSDTGHVQQVSVVPVDNQFDSVTVQDLTPVALPAPRCIRLRVVNTSL